MLAPAPVAEPWTGFYLGISGGGLWSRMDGSFVNPPPATWRVDRDAAIFGGQIGMQKQWGAFVLGVEADGLAILSNGFGSDTCHPTASCVAGSTMNDKMSRGFFTIGPRIGLSMGAWMPYLTGGYATGPKVRNEFRNSAGALIDGGNSTHHGGFAGAGLDWMVSPSWILGAEYRHYFLNTATVVPLTAAGAPVAADTYTMKPKADTVVLRLSYLFGWMR